MEKRTNEEYTIIDSLQVGRIEYVLGERPTHHDRYVVWECLNGSEYRQGDYTSDLGEAHGYMYERASKELQRQRDAGQLPPASVQKLDFEEQNKPCLYIRPLLPSEQQYAFAQSQQLKGQCGEIGHLRGDFDTGSLFCTTWDEYRSSLSTQEFKAELDWVVGNLRQGQKYGHMLRNRSSMQSYCTANPDSRLADKMGDGFGFRVDTESHSYLLRCKPAPGEYDFHLYAYRSEWLNQHMQNASFGIRFIDSGYNELFRISDGDNIVITGLDLSQFTRTCRYIDETHVEVGDNLYHICEFAERMEKAGNIYTPEVPTEQADRSSKKPKKEKPDMER